MMVNIPNLFGLIEVRRTPNGYNNLETHLKLDADFTQ